MARPPARRTVDQLPGHVRRAFAHERCTDFDDVLDQALADGKVHKITAWPDGRPLASAEDANELRQKIYGCKPAKRTHSVKCVGGQPGLKGIVQLAPGKWAFQFQVFSKDVGRANIADRAERGEELAYNPAARAAETVRPGRPGASGSVRATEQQQMALRSPLKQTIREVAMGDKRASAVKRLPDVPPAPAGFCEGCGIRLRDSYLASGLCPGCDVNVATIRLKAQELAEARKVAVRPRNAAPAQLTPAERFRALFKG